MTASQPVNEQLAYCFHPPVQPHDIGHPRLDVVIHAAPTGEHFDPELLICPVADGDRSTSMDVRHPWTQELTYRVCAGDVVIEDRDHERLTAFTFGGTLTIDADQRRVVSCLTSPAPLLEYSSQPAALEQQLIDEVNILFAERRATQDEDAFAQRLAAADPVLLYRACLAALYAKFEHFPAQDEPHQRFKHFLHNAIATSTEENIPALIELL